MQPKEGESPRSLSDYVSGRLNDIASQKAEAERQAILGRNKQMDLYIQRTASVRAYLLELVKPLDELLAHFRVRELLEEVQGMFPQGGKIKKLEPLIYQDIVTQPDPTTQGFVLEYGPKLRRKSVYNVNSLSVGKSSWVSLDDLLNPDNLQRLIPRLVGKEQSNGKLGQYPDGYGFALEGTLDVLIDGLKRDSIPGSTRWLGPGGGDIVTPTTYFWKKTGSRVSVPATHTLFVEVIESSLHTYDLSCSFISRINAKDPYGSTGYLIPPTRIFSSTEPEGLKRIIGDQIAREFASNHPNG